MIGPTLFTSAFKQAVPLSQTIGDPMIGMPFYLAALLHIIALGIVIGSTHKVSPTTNTSTEAA